MSKKKSKSKSKSTMAERAKQRAKEREGHRSGGGSGTLSLPDGVEYFKPDKKGKYKLDILPYKVSSKNHPEVKKGELWYQRTVWIHFGIGADDKVMICPQTIKKPCPICEEWKKLRKDDTADEDMVKALRAKERELFNVIDLNGDEEKVLLFEYSYHLFGKLLEEELEGDEGDEIAGFADLEGGKTLEVKFRQKKLGKNKFLEATSISFEDRDEYDEAIMEDVIDLDAILNIPTYEELQKAFLEIEDDDSDEDDDEEEKSKSKKKKKKSKKIIDDDDEEDEDEDEDDEEEDVEDDESEEEDEEVDDDDIPDGMTECIACEGDGKSSKGKKCKACKGKGYVPEDDEDEDDEDEDEEEEKSKKKAKKKSKKRK